MLYQKEYLINNQSVMKRIVAGMALCLWIGVSHAQVGKNNPYWIFSGQYINVNSLVTPPATAIQVPGSQQSNPVTKTSVNNAIFDKNGQVIFHLVKRGINELYAVDRFGTENLITNVTGFSDSNNELAIIPVPSNCGEYYIVYKNNLITSPQLVYSKLRYSNNTARLTVIEVGVFFGQTGLVANLGFAVGNTFPPSNNRYLYVVGFQGEFNSLSGPVSRYIVKYLVTQTGIFLDQVLRSEPGTSPNPIYECREADLNNDGNALYWGDINSIGRLRKFNLNTNSLSTFPSSDGSYSGVEFQENGSNDRVFYSVENTSGDNGIFYVNEDGSSVSPNPVLSSNTFNKSHIERGTDGLLYVSDGTTLRGINGTAATPTLGPSLSISNPLLNGFYSLPDQLDGENYGNSPVLPVCDAVEVYNNVSSNAAGTGSLPRFTEVSNSITASNSITSSAVNVVAGSQVEFKAQNEIILRPGSGNDNGFRAVAGSEFRAYIDDCRLAATCNLTSNRIALVVEDGSTSEKLELDEALSIEVFPNPTTGRITILSKGLNPDLPLKASLYTRDGKLIKSWEWTKPAVEESLLLEGADTFVLRLEQGETRFTQTIIIQP